MKLSVILCTYNRCESLAKAVESVAQSSLPESIDWEVLVIDNNSNDATRQVVDSFISKYPRRFRYVFEPKPGKSNALNTGIQEAKGDILAFTDDDVTVPVDWLYRLIAPLSNPDWIGVGGRILPDRDFIPPKWMSPDKRYALSPLAIFDPGPDSAQMKDSPFGANMAFRREAFTLYGGFRRDLGPCPGSEMKSEDKDFSDRLQNAGEKLWYEASAVVYHSIPESRVQQRYFLNWWFAKTRSDVRLEPEPLKSFRSVAGIPLFLLRRVIIWGARWLFSVHPAKRFQSKINVWCQLGAIAEYRTRGIRKAAQLACRKSCTSAHYDEIR